MLNAFHVRRSKEVECQKGARRLRATARTAGRHTTTGGETRVRKLCYRSVNASEKVQLPPASDVRHGGDSAWPELGVDPLLAISADALERAPDRERALSARERAMSLYPTRSFNQRFGGYSRIALTTLHRKKKATPLSDRLRNFTT